MSARNPTAMGISLRICFALVALGTIVASANAGVSRPAISTPPPLKADPFLELETYRIWDAPRSSADNGGAENQPTVTVFRPQAGKGIGTAIVVAPGGGYIGLAGSLEGRQVADWFASRGVTAFLLKYRVGSGNLLPVPLTDGKRAMQWARTYAEKFGIDPNRIGMIGFSAGGHLSAMTAATASPAKVDAQDMFDRVSSRPDFLVLGYPWLEGTVPGPGGLSQYCEFIIRLANGTCNSLDFQDYAPVRLVGPNMPPTFIYHTTSDELVPVEGSVRLYQALLAAHVPAEFHAFAEGHHGTGLGGNDPALDRWPDLLENWMRQQGLLTKNPSDTRAIPDDARH